MGKVLVELLNDNDWNSLAVSLRRLEETTLVRTLGPVRVAASTVPASRVWPVAMLVEVRVEAPHITMRQYFESAEEARRTIGRWRI